MYRFKDVKLRKFQFEDIPLKVKWINMPENNQFLGYDLPLEYEKTCKWFESVRDRTDRFDGVIEYYGKPVGLMGLLDIDYKNRKAVDYSLIGDLSVRGKGIATKAGLLNFAHAYCDLGLNKICGTIEVGNEASLRRWLRCGGHVEGYLREDRWRGDNPVDEYLVAHYKREFHLPESCYWEEQ